MHLQSEGKSFVYVPTRIIGKWTQWCKENDMKIPKCGRFKYEFTKALQQLEIPKREFTRAMEWWKAQVQETTWARTLFRSVRGRKAALPHKKRFIVAVMKDYRKRKVSGEMSDVSDAPADSAEESEQSYTGAGSGSDEVNLSRM